MVYAHTSFAGPQETAREAPESPPEAAEDVLSAHPLPKNLAAWLKAMATMATREAGRLGRMARHMQTWADIAAAQAVELHELAARSRDLAAALEANPVPAVHAPQKGGA